METLSSWPLALATALLPACVRLWQDRTLLRFENDPTLPERLLARRKSNQALVIVLGIATGVFWIKHAPWAGAVLILADVAAGYPLRKQLFGETWSLPAYLWFVTRMLVANLGFWVVLALTPALAGVWHTSPWIVPAGTAVLLLAWHERLPEVVRSLLRVRPIADAALLARFEDLSRRSSAPLPRFERLDLRGGVVINAFALASRRTASVIFTDTLLARLEPDEIVAICAHEIAHLEYYGRARLGGYALATRALIVCAALTPLMPLLGPVAADLIWLVWPVLLVSTLIWRAKDRQRNETVSDQRAVTLTGNAEAVASALTKLYTWGRVPRRFSSEFEQRATHPSLARRIRDIRAAAGAAAPLPTVTETFASADGATHIAFEPSRLRWTVGNSAEHTLAYSGLTELRIHAAGSRNPKLIAVDGTGHKWEMPIEAPDAARLQSALDGVDGLIANAAPPPRIRPQLARVVLLTAGMVGTTIGQPAALLAALAALIAPSAPLLAAAGVASCAAAAIALRTAGQFLWPLTLLLAAIGAALCVMAYIKRNDAGPRASDKALGLLAVLAAVALLLVPMTGLDPVRLHQAVESLPSGPVLLVALGSALALRRERWSRTAALAVLVLAAFLVFVGSMTFLERVARDPLLVNARHARVIRVAATSLAQYDLPSGTSSVQLSPGAGAYISSRSEPGDDDPGRRHYEVARAGQSAKPLRADQAAFLDDDRLLAAHFDDTGANVTLLNVDRPDTPTWQTRVDGVTSGTLTAGADGSSWRLLGRAPDLSLVSARGRIGSSSSTVLRWRSDRRAWFSAIETSGSAAIAMSKNYETGSLMGPRYLGIVPLLLGVRSTLTFWHLDVDGATPADRSQLDANCMDSIVEGTLVCIAFDGINTRIATVEAFTGRTVGVATIAGRFAALPGVHSRGWLTGWAMGTATAVRLASGDAFAVPRPGYGYIRALAASDAGIAAIITAAGRPRLALYAVPR